MDQFLLVLWENYSSGPPNLTKLCPLLYIVLLYHIQTWLYDYISLCIILIALLNDIICMCQEWEFENVGARR